MPRAWETGGGGMSQVRHYPELHSMASGHPKREKGGRENRNHPTRKLLFIHFGPEYSCLYMSTS